MTQTLALISTLHESAAQNSATREFRNRPVLDWTLSRLARSHKLDATTTILCWQDQAFAIQPIAHRHNATLIPHPRSPIPHLDSTSAALRWSDGWRGGLLATCHFDEGFDARLILQAAADAERIALVQPCAGLIDPALTDGLITHATDHPELDLIFTQAAPGLAPVILSKPLLDRLAAANAHPGKLLNYSPDTPGRDPITSAACMRISHPGARTFHRFTLDSPRQIQKIQAATAHLNGRLISTSAEELIDLLSNSTFDRFPREVTLELTCRRASKPIYSAATHPQLTRSDLPFDAVKSIVDQLAAIEDLRLTFAGAGDPLLHPYLCEIIEYARESGIRAMHLETDLLDVTPKTLQWLANAPLDILTIHLSALTPATYQRLMGTDALPRVLDNITTLLRARKAGLPILVPTFTKCRENLEEMEPWYDQWLRALGAAAIVGPSDYAGQIPDHACADMSGPIRKPCRRLNSRMTILSDGAIVACEQDILGRHPLGKLPQDNILEVWQTRFQALRESHQRNQFNIHPLCGTCREWSRP
jgi:spiro-SPASM protein